MDFNVGFGSGSLAAAISLGKPLNGHVVFDCIVWNKRIAADYDGDQAGNFSDGPCE